MTQSKPNPAKCLAIILKSPHTYAFLTSYLFLVLYLATSPRHNVSYADSDLLTIIGHQLGVAHPPGYPYLILLINFFTHLPVAFPIAFKANLVSATFHTATLYILYLATYRLITHLQPKLSFLTRTYASTLSTSFLGANYLFWLYSIVAEKYALNDFFISLTLYFIIRLTTTTPKARPKFLYLLVFVISLALGHHHTYFLFLPAIAIFFWQQRRLILPRLIPLALIFLLVQTFFISTLLFLNSRQAHISWNFTPTPNGLYRMVTRRDLSGYQVIEGKYRGIYLDPVSLEEILHKIPLHLQVFTSHFGWLASLLIAAGIFYLVQLQKPPRLPLLSVTIFTTIFIPLYLDWPPDLSTQGIRIRMYLAGWTPLVPVAGLGLLYLRQLITKTALTKAALTLAGIAAVIIQTNHLATTFNHANLKDFTLISRLYADSLAALPPNTFLACISDTSCFATLYAQQIHGLRPDVFILPHANNIIKNQLDRHPEFTTFNYPDNPELYLDYLTTNLKNRPVYIIELQQLYYNLLGLNYGFFGYQPSGYLGQLTSKPQEFTHQPDYTYSKLLSQIKFPSIDHYRPQLQASIAQKHLLHARILALHGQDPSLIDSELDLARQLSTNLPPMYQTDVNQAAQQIRTYAGFDQYVPGTNQPTTQEILDQASAYYHQGDDDNMYLGLTNILWHQPDHQSARHTLAWLYETRGYQEEAHREYQILLQLFPDDPKAQAGLKRTQPSN